MVASRLQLKPLWSRRTVGSLLQKREAKRVNGFFRAALLTSLSCSEPTDPLDEVENASMNWIMSGLHMARMSRRRSQAFRLPSNTWSLQSLPPTCIESLLTVCEEEFWVLHDSLGMSEMHCRTKNRCKFTSEEGLIAILLRLASRGTWLEHAALLGVSPTRLCHVFQTTMDFLRDKWLTHAFESNGTKCIPPNRAATFADAIVKKSGAGLDCVVGFIDSTKLQICRSENYTEQLTTYSGYHKCHCVRYQGVQSPDGIMYHLYGPVEGRRGDGYLLATSRLFKALEHLESKTRTNWVVYGDAAYAMNRYVQCGYRKGLGERVSGSTSDTYTKLMNSVRTSVEWAFGYIKQKFPFLNVVDYMKIGNSRVHDFYTCATFLANCITCLRGNATSSFFDTPPPSLQEYLHYCKFE